MSSTDLEKLTQGLVHRDHFFAEKGYQSPIENWDKLSKVNPLQAVISAGTNKEAKKNAAAGNIEILKEKLNDGVVLDLGCGYGCIAKYFCPLENFLHMSALIAR